MNEPMTPAQAAQQNNRHTDGTYATKVHAEHDTFTPPATAEARDQLPDVFVDQLLNSGRYDDDLADDFQPSPESRNDMSDSVTAVCDAINAERDIQLSWNHVYDTSGMILDDYGYLEEGRSGRIVRADLEELADWDSTEGWAQVASLRDNILRHMPVPETGHVISDYARTDVVIVEGGIVQSTPDLPVFDLDVLDSTSRDEATVDEVVDLLGRATAHNLHQVTNRCEVWLQSAGLFTCDQCGDLFTVNVSGVAQHVNPAGYAQHDADADHVPYNTDRQP